MCAPGPKPPGPNPSAPADRCTSSSRLILSLLLHSVRFRSSPDLVAQPGSVLALRAEGIVQGEGALVLAAYAVDVDVDAAAGVAHTKCTVAVVWCTRLRLTTIAQGGTSGPVLQAPAAVRHPAELECGWFESCWASSARGCANCRKARRYRAAARGPAAGCAHAEADAPRLRLQWHMKARQPADTPCATTCGDCTTVARRSTSDCIADGQEIQHSPALS
jgi:hypothetical protein